MVFRIKNGALSYGNNVEVLRIPEFEISTQGLYFFIGASGIGKSTLLETLGMMNDTILSKSEEVCYVDKNEKKIDLRSLWSKNDAELSSFRSKEYSFIFQNTNLMHHFTAGENMIYTLLLEGVSAEKAKERVIQLMPMLGLDFSIYDKNIQHISGGQRQRLAFLRAFVSTFEVLFGDEPTGNLDPVTATGIMKILQTFIKSENKTAIIVSHDIHLASTFADRIYYISKSFDNDENSLFGLLDNSQYFEKRNNVWYHGSSKVDGDIIEELKRFL